MSKIDIARLDFTDTNYRHSNSYKCGGYVLAVLDDPVVFKTTPEPTGRDEAYFWLHAARFELRAIHSIPILAKCCFTSALSRCTSASMSLRVASYRSPSC